MPLTVTTVQFAGGTSFYDDPEALGVSNYLYWLCGKFQLEGQRIINGVGGGTVVPFNPNNPGGGSGGGGGTVVVPNPIEFEVSPTSFIPEGIASATITSFAGYNLLFVRNNIPQSTVNMGGGSSYYSWNRTTGQFTCFPVAQADELFQLYPFN